MMQGEGVGTFLSKIAKKQVVGSGEAGTTFRQSCGQRGMGGLGE